MNKVYLFDKRILQLIERWLKAGVVDGKSLQISKRGTPQGNIISPLLCNVYMHYALDKWLHEIVRPLLKGEIFLIRYADDFIIGFEYAEDAHRVNSLDFHQKEKLNHPPLIF